MTWTRANNKSRVNTKTRVACPVFYLEQWTENLYLADNAPCIYGVNPTELYSQAGSSQTGSRAIMWNTRNHPTKAEVDKNVSYNTSSQILTTVIKQREDCVLRVTRYSNVIIYRKKKKKKNNSLNLVFSSHLIRKPIWIWSVKAVHFYKMYGHKIWEMIERAERYIHNKHTHKLNCKTGTSKMHNKHTQTELKNRNE